MCTLLLTNLFLVKQSDIRIRMCGMLLYICGQICTRLFLLCMIQLNSNSTLILNYSQLSTDLFKSFVKAHVLFVFCSCSVTNLTCDRIWHLQLNGRILHKSPHESLYEFLLRHASGGLDTRNTWFPHKWLLSTYIDISLNKWLQNSEVV